MKHMFLTNLIFIVYLKYTCRYIYIYAVCFNKTKVLKFYALTFDVIKKR